RGIHIDPLWRIAIPLPVCSELRLQSRGRSDTQLPEYAIAVSSSSTRDCTSKASTAIVVSLAFAFFCPVTVTRYRAAAALSGHASERPRTASPARQNRRRLALSRPFSLGG